MAIQPDADLDLVATTQKQLGPGKFSDIAAPLQEYVAMGEILKKNRVSFDSGTSITWRVMTGTSGAAKNIGLFATDTTAVADVFQVAEIPWRSSTTSYIIDKHEISINRSPSRIVNLVKARRADGMIDLAKLLEDNWWGKPVDSTDTTTPFGVDYWVVRNASAGFNGGNPSGFSSGSAGISSSTYTRWANYTDRYTTVNKTDFVAKARMAFTKTNWMAPVEVTTFDTGTRRAMYTNYSVLASLESIAEAQNDRLGKDVASMDGEVVFRRTPVKWVPKLDSDTGNPFYGIDWGEFKVAILSDWYMRETGPSEKADQHNVIQTFIDLTYNFQCTNRRKQFVLDTGN
jgi:hypothetical protein